jgi:hypothetical protein
VAIIFGRGLLARLLLSLLSLPLLKSGLASELGAGSSTHHKRLSLRNLCKPAVRSLRTYLCPSSLIVIIAISALLIFADFQPPELSSTAPTMSILPTVIVSLLTFILLLRFLIFPVLFRALTNFRVSSRPSLRSRLIIWNGSRLPRRMREFQPYGIEWLRWAWGGLSGDEVGLVVLPLDGVSFRIREKSNSSGAHVDVRERPKVRSCVYLRTSVNSVAHSFSFLVA